MARKKQRSVNRGSPLKLEINLPKANSAMSLMDQLEDALDSLEARMCKNIRRINSIMKV